jgi:5'-nucleotidase
MQFRRLSCAFVFSLVALSSARADDFKLKIIAFNDFHGNLQSPGKFRANAQSPNVAAGGVDFLAGYVKQLKSEDPYNVVVSAGDLTGASPLASSLFHDEGTIETMNRLGLELNAVGNHEFDHGRKELLRLQRGGCAAHDQNTCKGAETGTPVPFEGAKFEYLAANVFDTSTGKTIFPPYAIKTYNGVQVAFIGLTLKDTPSIVAPAAIAGLRFADEATTINSIVRELHKQGIEIFVVLIHQGGLQVTNGTPDINGCEGGLDGSPIQSVVNKLDDAVDLVISAHSHAAYICRIPNSAGRRIPVTSASSFGRVITDIDMTVDKNAGNLKSIAAENIVVDRTGASGVMPDNAIKSIADKYASLAAPVANRKVGSVSADITKMRNAAGESALGDLIADADLEATSPPGSGGAVVAFMNEGGIRTDIAFASGTPGVANGDVTHGELFTVEPFGNTLLTMTLTGAQIKDLLEEQFKGCALDSPTGDKDAPPYDRFLQVSQGFTYTWNSAGEKCNKVDSGSIKINGTVVAPSAKYRVTVNNFIADGGDQDYVLTKGTDRLGGPQDLDALAAYFSKHGSLAPSRRERIKMIP